MTSSHSPDPSVFRRFGAALVAQAKFAQASDLKKKASLCRVGSALAALAAVAAPATFAIIADCAFDGEPDPQRLRRRPTLFSQQYGNLEAQLSAERACTLSHRLAWTRLRRAPMNAASFSRTTFISVKISARSLAETSGWQRTRSSIKSKPETTRLGGPFRRKPIRGGRTIARLHSTHLGSAAYVISRAGIEKMLRRIESRGVGARRDAVRRTRGIPEAFRSYQMIPALAIQDELLRGKSGFVGLESAITLDRLARPKRRDMRKLASEAGRPFRQLAEAVMPLHW